MFSTLETIALENCYFDIYNNANVNIIPLYIWYNVNNNIEIIDYVISDILSMLNKNKLLDNFKYIYPKVIKYIDKHIFDHILSNNLNNIYFKSNYFNNLLLIEFTENLCFNGMNYDKCIKYDNSYNCFDNYKIGESVIPPVYKILENFKRYTKNLFDNFNWSNCIMAGGMINKIVNKDFDAYLDSGAYNNSDIDIYVYGQTKKKKEKLVYIINYLREILGYYYIVNFPNVICLYFPTYHREIQLVVGNYKSPLQIINDFDFSHLQILFDGKNIKGTIYNKEALQSQTSRIIKKFTYKLIEKTYKSGFMIENKELSIYDRERLDYIMYDINTKHNKTNKNKYIRRDTFFENNKSIIKNVPTNLDILKQIKQTKNVECISCDIDVNYINFLELDYTKNFSNSYDFYG